MQLISIKCIFHSIVQNINFTCLSLHVTNLQKQPATYGMPITYAFPSGHQSTTVGSHQYPISHGSLAGQVATIAVVRPWGAPEGFNEPDFLCGTKTGNACAQLFCYAQCAFTLFWIRAVWTANICQVSQMHWCDCRTKLFANVINVITISNYYLPSYDNYLNKNTHFN